MTTNSRRVIVIDAFFWGERRIQYRQPPPELARALEGLESAEPRYIQAVNTYLRQRNSELNTWLAFCGTSWMGIVAHDDRRSLDVLASLPEVDRARMGCVGLSGGGYRATYLTGMDPRVRASVRERDPELKHFFYKDRTVVVGMTLDRSGHVTELSVLQSSNVDFFDRVALTSVREAEPFPNPPGGLFGSEQTTRFGFTFTFVAGDRRPFVMWERREQ